MTIIRVKHNRENPYVQLNKEALFSEKLSLKAKGLWASCLSRPDDWTFYIAEIIKHTKEKKTAIYSAIKELIANGYAMRFEMADSKTGRFERPIYYFFEFSLTEDERVKFAEEFSEEMKELKKCLPHSGFPHTGVPHTENRPLLIKKDISLKKTDTNKEKENIQKKTGTNVPLASKEAYDLSNFSNEVKENLELLCKSLRTLKSDYKITDRDMKNWAKDIDLILRIDKRNPLELKEILLWLPKDNFWPDKIKSGEKLRKQYDTLAIQVKKKQSEKYKLFAGKVKALVRSKNLNINDVGVFDPSVELELTYKMPYPDFCHCIAKAYSIAGYEKDM